MKPKTLTGLSAFHVLSWCAYDDMKVRATNKRYVGLYGVYVLDIFGRLLFVYNPVIRSYVQHWYVAARSYCLIIFVRPT